MAGRYGRNNNYSQNIEDFDEGDMWGVLEDNNNNNNSINFNPSSSKTTKKFTKDSNFTAVINSSTTTTSPRMIPRSSPEVLPHCGKKQSSAPLDIPDWSKIYGTNSRNKQNGTSSSSSSSSWVNNYPNVAVNNGGNNNYNSVHQYNYYGGVGGGYNNRNNGHATGGSDNYYKGDEDDNDDDDDEIDGMVPPHEYLAKKFARNQISSFSVCEGIGRTLKGRDLSKVRNTILSKTGFLE